MHVPPGANSQGMAGDTPGQLNEDNVSMNWDPDIQAWFMSTIEKYPGVVTLVLAGHRTWMNSVSCHRQRYRTVARYQSMLWEQPRLQNLDDSPRLIGSDGLPIVQLRPLWCADADALPEPLSVLDFLRFDWYAGLFISELYPPLLRGGSERNSYTYYYASGSTAVNRRRTSRGILSTRGTGRFFPAPSAKWTSGDISPV